MIYADAEQHRWDVIQKPVHAVINSSITIPAGIHPALFVKEPNGKNGWTEIITTL